MDRFAPRPGEVWKHFKGNLYRIIGLAFHSETKEKMVIYKRIDAPRHDLPCVRPLEMFMSKTDREKYSDARQEWRFERVRRADEPLE